MLFHARMVCLQVCLARLNEKSRNSTMSRNGLPLLRRLCASIVFPRRTAVLLVAVGLVMTSPMLGASQETSATTVTIMNIDKNKGIVTVRNDATGTQRDFNIETAEELQSLKVGQILSVPAVQPRSSESDPPTKASKDQPDEAGCYERCRRTGSAILECLYWCANR